MAEHIAIFPGAAVAVSEAPQPMPDGWSRQPQFGMSFEEQQEVLYQTLMSFQEPEPQHAPLQPVQLQQPDSLAS